MKRFGAICAQLLFACCSAGATDISGTYVDETDPSMTLVLREQSDGMVRGEFEGQYESLPIEARRNGGRLTGTVGSGEEAIEFAATIAQDGIAFQLIEGDAGHKQVFRRVGDATAADKTTQPSSTAAGTMGTTSTTAAARAQR